MKVQLAGRNFIQPHHKHGILRCPVCESEGVPGGQRFCRGAKQGHSCKSCANDRLRKWRATSAASREWSKKNRDMRRELIDSYKMARGCTECGYCEHPAALDFHHVDAQEKTCPVGQMSNGASIERIAAEIAKCIVLCSNCHRIHTWKR